MGLSASQARLMSMTSRLSDLELRAQQISNAKVRLSDMSEEASRAYSDALDKQTMTIKGFSSGGVSSASKANINNLYSGSTSGIEGDLKLRYITNASGKVYIPADLVALSTAAGTNTRATFIAHFTSDTSSSSAQYYGKLFDSIAANNYINTNTLGSNATSSEWLQNQVDAGNLYLNEFDSTGGTGTGGFQNVSWTSGDATLAEKTDDTNTAKAESDYETTMAAIQSKEQRFDLQLKSIDTEHTATQTEIESIGKVISKNIERTLKIFDA